MEVGFVGSVAPITLRKSVWFRTKSGDDGGGGEDGSAAVAMAVEQKCEIAPRSPFLTEKDWILHKGLKEEEAE